ncbi:MAG: response regulator transcription factor [Chloroflexota bacterium]
MARHPHVDDDTLMRRGISLHLERQAGYRTSTAASAEDALGMIRLDEPDLVLLDVGLPGMDGLEALRHFQREMDVPIIFVTARRRELDTILGLEMGADDYVTKPFNPDELLARIKAVLRRSDRQGSPSSAEPDTLTVGDTVISPAAHTVVVDGRSVDLTAKEFAVLQTLAMDAGKVVSTEDLLNRVWGAEYDGEPQVVYVNIRWLREKIEADPQNPERIINVRGVGYKLMPIGEQPDPDSDIE